MARTAVTLLAAITAGLLFGVQLVVLTLAAAALLLVIWLLWSSVQALTGESELTFEEAFSLGTRSAEEEQKRAVLRALKDLEYERSVGKISEEDYHEYSARYRAEAKRLIQSLDENLAEGRKQVEFELERRLNKKVAKVKPNDSPEAEASRESRPDGGERVTPASASANAKPSAARTRECPGCQVKTSSTRVSAKPAARAWPKPRRVRREHRSTSDRVLPRGSVTDRSRSRC